MEPGEQCFSVLNLGDDGLCVCSNKMRGADGNSAHLEAVAREGVGQTSGVEGKFAVGAVNDGAGGAVKVGHFCSILISSVVSSCSS